MPRTRQEKIDAAKKRHGFTAINKPRRGGPKKFEVLAVEGDQVKKINFGDPNMRIKKDQPVLSGLFSDPLKNISLVKPVLGSP